MWSKCEAGCDRGCGLALYLAQKGGKVKNFLSKKNKKKISKKCTFPLDNGTFCPIFIVEMGGSTEFPKGEKNGYRLQNFQPYC
jgi:hypothetical protein